MQSVIGCEPDADVIQASGQATWTDLVQVETSKHTEGQHVTSSPVLTLTQSKAVPLLLMLAGSFTMGYASLHHGVWMSSITISLGWVSPAVPQSTVLANSSSHRGVSSVLTCTMLALFPFSHHW